MAGAGRLIAFTGCSSPPAGRALGAGGDTAGASRGGGAGARSGGVTLAGRGSTQDAAVPETGGAGANTAVVLAAAGLDSDAPLKARTGSVLRGALGCSVTDSRFGIEA